MSDLRDEYDAYHGTYQSRREALVAVLGAPRREGRYDVYERRIWTTRSSLTLFFTLPRGFPRVSLMSPPTPPTYGLEIIEFTPGSIHTAGLYIDQAFDDHGAKCQWLLLHSPSPPACRAKRSPSGHCESSRLSTEKLFP